MPNLTMKYPFEEKIEMLEAENASLKTEVEQLKKQINQLKYNQRCARETEHTPIPVYTVDSFLKTYCGHCGNPADCCVCITPDRDKFKTIIGALHPCGG